MNRDELLLYKNILQKMDFENILKYQKPFLITLSGFPGSGKTTLAKELSRQNKIFLLSQDFIRTYYSFYIQKYSEVKKEYINLLAKRCNIQRMIKLIYNRASFIFDSDISTYETYKQLKILCMLVNYDLIKIKINSFDHDNVDRIVTRPCDPSMIDPSITGDSINYDTNYPEEDYFKIKDRKKLNLDCVHFDYIIDNYKAKENFLDEVKMIGNDIKIKRLVYEEGSYESRKNKTEISTCPK